MLICELTGLKNGEEKQGDGECWPLIKGLTFV